MALITSDCDAMRSPGIKWTYSPRIVRPPVGYDADAWAEAVEAEEDDAVERAAEADAAAGEGERHCFPCATLPSLRFRCHSAKD